MALPLYDLINNINKQLKNICCKIEQEGGGGGSSTNIYNSDGTLTGNRELVGGGYELRFSDLNQFYVRTTNSFTAQFALTDNIFKTIYNTNDIGLKLDFVNNEYILGDSITQFGFQLFNSNRTAYIGDSNGNFNGTTFDLNDIAQNIQTLIAGNTAGIRLNGITSTYVLGQYQGNNTTTFVVDDFNQIIKTTNQNNDIGLKLDFANNIYQFGDIANSWGLDVRYGIYKFGDYGGSNNYTFITIDDGNSIIKTSYANSDIGLKLDFANTIYQFGQISGGNTKTFTIDDAAGFGFQFSGTGITQATTGANSGQYLKVKVGGTDYVIELKNPS